MLKVGVVGAGQGGLAILKTLINASEIDIIGICDKNMKAPGIKMARQKKIAIFDNFEEMLLLNGKKILIEVTGREDIYRNLRNKADQDTTIVDSDVALLIKMIVDSRQLIIEHLENESKNLSDLASNLSTTIEETNTNSLVNSQDLNNTVMVLLNTAEKNKTSIYETNQIINFINKVANQTKMLGFNAAIEAHRAGNEGKGFGVVANEIRNLADETGESVKQITHFISELTVSTEETLNNIQDMQYQAEKFISVQDSISSTLSQVASQIQELSSILADLSQN